MCIFVYGTASSLDLQETQLPLSALNSEGAPDFSELGLSSVESHTGSSLCISCMLGWAY